MQNMIDEMQVLQSLELGIRVCLINKDNNHWVESVVHKPRDYLYHLLIMIESYICAIRELYLEINLYFRNLNVVHPKLLQIISSQVFIHMYIFSIKVDQLMLKQNQFFLNQWMPLLYSNQSKIFPPLFLWLTNLSIELRLPRKYTNNQTVLSFQQIYYFQKLESRTFSDSQEK